MVRTGHTVAVGGVASQPAVTLLVFAFRLDNDESRHAHPPLSMQLSAASLRCTASCRIRSSRVPCSPALRRAHQALAPEAAPPRRSVAPLRVYALQHTLRSGAPLLVTPRLAGLLLGVSTFFYSGCIAGSIGLAPLLRVPDVLLALAQPVPVLASLAYTAPLLLSLQLALVGAAKGLPALLEMRSIISSAMVPLLRAMPWPAWALLAAGAGVGEEALFRGVLLPACSQALVTAGVAASGATVLSAAATSLLFGALHAATPLYFAWATAASALFSLEMLTTQSLTACCVTHFAYDLVAFAVLQHVWASK